MGLHICTISSQRSISISQSGDLLASQWGYRALREVHGIHNMPCLIMLESISETAGWREGKVGLGQSVSWAVDSTTVRYT